MTIFVFWNSMFSIRMKLLVGLVFVVVGMGIIVVTIAPIVSLELNYQLKNNFANSPIGDNFLKKNNLQNEGSEISPVDREFGIVVPKIGANAKIVADVDPYNADVYQRALRRGVAHAKGSSLPGQQGNVFLFSHSSVDFYRALRYNSVFYLLNKMEKGDEIKVYYQDEEFTYVVDEVLKVKSDEVKYLEQFTPEKKLTLMTCWPAGTTWGRLLVVGKLDEASSSK